MLRIKIVAQNGSMHCASPTVAEQIIFTLNEKGIATYKVFGTRNDIYILHPGEKENSRYTVIDNFFKVLPAEESTSIIAQFKELVEPIKDEHYFMCDAIADEITLYSGNKKLFSAEIMPYDKIGKLYKKLEKLLNVEGFMICRDFDEHYEYEENQ